jgi:tetratricopeptide (TPR) repeat protein
MALPIEAQGAQLGKLAAAVDLYQGEFLAGLHVDDAVEFEDWQLEERGDVDEMALLKANLCLTLRQSGALPEALAYGLEAIEMLVSLGNTRIEGQARNRVGHTLAVLGRWGDAYAAYGEALAVWATVQHPNRYEAVAGRAVAALHLGKHAEALALVEETLDFTINHGLVGIVEPVRLYLNCEAVLTEVGLSERAHRALLQADDWVQTIASRISDESVRATFLAKRPDNQWLKSHISSRVRMAAPKTIS